MANNGADQNPQKGGLWARLFGVQQSREAEAAPAATPPAPVPAPAPAGAPAPESPFTDEPADEEVPPPTAEVYMAEDSDEPLPVAREPARVAINLDLDEPGEPAGAAVVEPAADEDDIFAAPRRPSESVFDDLPVPALHIPVTIPEPPPEAEPVPAEPAPVESPTPPPRAERVVPPAAAPAQNCPACGTPRAGAAPYCADCGWLFSSAPSAVPAVTGEPRPAPAAAPVPAEGLLHGRYQVTGLLCERAGVTRFQGLDLQGPGGQPRAVILVAGVPAAAPEAVALVEGEPVEDDDLDGFLPTFDEPAPAVAEVVAAGDASWPGVAWEKAVLEKANHPGLPPVLDSFAEEGVEYLVLGVPEGSLLWDAWDDPSSSPATQYGWLIQIAEALDALHRGGAMLEGLRPDLVTVRADGRAVLNDLTDLLPIPVPADPPIRGTLYTAPELMLKPQEADARADLYSFGAMLYALEYLHHALEEKDFERPYYPKLITDRYPDVHPAFNRLILKTFCRDLNLRFPTDEASRKDGTGFTELIQNLKVCQKTFARVRLDVAAWTTTGMVRTNNEDAFAFLHAVESRQDDLTEYGLVLLCDGMGGYEAGEVAAAMTIHELRSYLLRQPLFAALAGQVPSPEAEFTPEKCRIILDDALKHANKAVHTAARTPGKGKRGMGCTAEAVYIDDQYLVVGHVGDSRTYHMSGGRLKQLTRDQTWVNRMVELGQLSEEEAETHDRKNELQQAIGGAPFVEPGLYHARLNRGDWVLVCSDGITNHVPTKDLEQMLRETFGSAEETARRLVNLVNLRGATDNATVVVIRVT